MIVIVIIRLLLLILYGTGCILTSVRLW